MKLDYTYNFYRRKTESQSDLYEDHNLFNVSWLKKVDMVLYLLIKTKQPKKSNCKILPANQIFF